MKNSRHFVIHNDDGSENGLYIGKIPRQAALKAATRLGGTVGNPVEIKLRERGTKKLHIYAIWRELVAAPENKPAWLPEIINKPFVKKLGTAALTN